MCFYIVLDLPLDFWLCSFLVLGQWYFPHVWTWTYNWKRLCMGLETFMLFDLGCEFWMCLFLHVVLWLWMWNIWLYVYLYEYVCEFCGQKKGKEVLHFFGNNANFRRLWSADGNSGCATNFRRLPSASPGWWKLSPASRNFHRLALADGN